MCGHLISKHNIWEHSSKKTTVNKAQITIKGAITTMDYVYKNDFITSWLFKHIIPVSPSLHEANGEHKREEELVLLKQGPAHIVVDAPGEMVIEGLYPLGQVGGGGAVGNGLEVQVDEPCQGVLVHGLNVGQV